MSLHSPQGLTFWCHNIGRSHSSWLALLSEWGESGPDVMLIQEPPWVQVGRARSLSSPEGDKIFGLPSSPGFHTFLPDASSWSSSSMTERPRTILLVHKRWTALSVQYRQDLSPTRDICTVVLNVKWNDGSPCPLFISSIYIAAPDETNTLDRLLGTLDVPPQAHWILAGDTNQHHSDWSLHMAPSAAPGAARYLRDFIRGQSLTILNDPEVATRHSPEGRMSTVLDLVLSSPSLEELGMESSLEISFDSASSSDHALLTWALPLDAVQLDTFTSNRLPKTAMDKWKSHVVPRLYSLFTRGGDIHDLIPQVDDSLLSSFSSNHQVASSKIIFPRSLVDIATQHRTPWSHPPAGCLIRRVEVALRRLRMPG